MPIYEYECDNCGHTMEKIQRMSDDPLKDCPECETSALRKLISAAVFKLKGTGWYETDFKDQKDMKSEGKDASKDKDSKSSDNATSDSKPDAKKEAGKESKKDDKKDSPKVNNKGNKPKSASKDK